MSVVQKTFGLLGQDGVTPRRVQMVVTDGITALTTAGYITQSSIYPDTAYPTDIFDIIYSYNSVTNTGTYGEFICTIGVNGIITLSVANVSDGVTYTAPSVASHIAYFTTTTGNISSASGTTIINGGSIQAGLSGTAGTLISYPATSSKGSLIVAGVANTGNTNTTISNDAMGQVSVVNIPDPVNAIGQFVIGATATPFVSGNFPQNSGTAGLMVDSGLAVSNVVSKIASNVFSGSGQITLAKVNGTEASNAVTASGNAGIITTSSLTTAGGASYAITWTNTKITSTSVFSFCIQGGTNTTQNITFECVPGSGTATLTIYNNTTATALNGTIFIGYSVL